MMSDISIREAEDVHQINSSVAQVLSMIIKEIINQPRLFITTLSNRINMFEDIMRVAFTGFGSLFGYFLSQDMSINASQIVISLVHTDLPDSKVMPFALAFIFSSYCFFENLWFHFQKNIDKFNNPTSLNILESLRDSIKMLLPLIPNPVFFVIRELFEYRVSSLCELLFKYLFPASFHLWLLTPLGISFQFTNLIMKYFSDNIEWPSDDAVSIISSFMLHSHVIQSQPSFGFGYRQHNEFLIFSKNDIMIIDSLFIESSQQFPMFDSLKEFTMNTNDYYQPFFYFFYHQNSSFYSITSDNIAEFGIVNDIISLLLEKQFCIRFLLTITKHSELLFLNYMNNMVKGIKTPSLMIDSLVDTMVAPFPNKNIVYHQIYLSLLSKFDIHLYEIPKDILNKINEHLMNFFQKRCQMGIKKAGYLYRISKVLHHRRNLTLQELYILYSYVLNSVHTISSSIAEFNNDTRSNLLSFILRSSFSEEHFHVFFVFEKLFSRTRFYKVIPVQDFRNWKMFIQLIWGVLSLDPDLHLSFINNRLYQIT